MAEAGLAELTTHLYKKEFGSIADTALGKARYRVNLYYDQDPPFAISIGKAGKVEKSIKVELSFLSPPYEHSVYAGNLDGEEYMFTLRGQGDPQAAGGGEVGGRDIINGNIYANLISLAAVPVSCGSRFIQIVKLKTKASRARILPGNC